MKNKKHTPEWHRESIAIETQKMPHQIINWLGGPSKQEAKEYLLSIGYTEKEIKKMEKK